MQIFSSWNFPIIFGDISIQFIPSRHREQSFSVLLLNKLLHISILEFYLHAFSFPVPLLLTDRSAFLVLNLVVSKLFLSVSVLKDQTILQLGLSQHQVKQCIAVCHLCKTLGLRMVFPFFATVLYCQFKYLYFEEQNTSFNIWKCAPISAFGMNLQKLPCYSFAFTTSFL